MTQPLPEVSALLTAVQDAPPPDPGLGVPELRAACDVAVLATHALVRDLGPLHAVVDLQVPVAGGTIPARLYLPSAAPALALHVHLHGGGWWMGSIATVDPMARELALGSGMAVLSVGYRLAPEHRWPTAAEDAFAALQWAASGPAEFGIAVTSLSVGGESAGANLAAAACLMARDRGGPPLVAQWLDVPAVDLTLPGTASLTDFGTGFGLEIAQVSMILDWYVDPADRPNPYVSPALAPDLSGLPPALVTTAELDPLRDQGEDFAAALQAAGNDVVLRRAEGHIHASSWLTGLTPSTAAWHDEVVAALVARHLAMEPA